MDACLRKLVLAATLGAGLMAPGTAGALSGVGDRRASAAIDFRIVIPPILRLRTLHQPPALVVTEADAAAGYVVVDEGVEVEVTSNVKSGHAVQVHLATPLVRGADVSGLGAPVRVRESGASVAFHPGRPAGATTFRLGFRLELAPGLPAGRYDWPVALTVVNG